MLALRKLEEQGHGSVAMVTADASSKVNSQAIKAAAGLAIISFLMLENTYCVLFSEMWIELN